MIFHDCNFNVTRIKGKYRVLEKKEFDKSYHSFVDVQAVRKMREGISYVTKYLRKDEHPLQTLTLALCWLFRKRSFAVSGDFHDIIYTMTTIRYRLVQTDLFGNKVKSTIAWIFIGIFQAKKFGIDRNEWWKVIADRAVLNDILT